MGVDAGALIGAIGAERLHLETADHRVSEHRAGLGLAQLRRQCELSAPLFAPETECAALLALIETLLLP
jgi:hypothetical protein